MGERFLAGDASLDEVWVLDHQVEGAAFEIDYNEGSPRVKRWVQQIREIPSMQLRSMLNPAEAADEIAPWELLRRAAYFVDYAIMYPSFLRKGLPNAQYMLFLSADLLREHVEFPAK